MIRFLSFTALMAVAILNMPSGAMADDATVATITNPDDAWINGQKTGEVMKPGNALFAGGHDAQPGFSRKVYLRYTLPQPLPEFGHATLQLTFFRQTQPKHDRKLSLYGILDATPADGPDGWDPAELTWNNAPANVKDSGSRVDPKQTVLLAEVVAKTGSEEMVFSDARLGEFLQADTNGRATFILAGDDNTVGGFLPTEMDDSASVLSLKTGPAPQAAASETKTAKQAGTPAAAPTGKAAPAGKAVATIDKPDDAWANGQKPDEPAPAGNALFAGGKAEQPGFSRKAYLRFTLPETFPPLITRP